MILKWISVKDELPPNDDKVIVYICKFKDLKRGGYEDFATWDGTMWERWDDLIGVNLENNPDYMGVTHWMPCPDNPKEELIKYLEYLKTKYDS